MALSDYWHKTLVYFGMAEDAEVGSAKRLQPSRRGFCDLTRRLDLVIQANEDTQAARRGRGGGADRIDQIEAGVSR